MPVSFATDVKILFRTRDIACMTGFGVQLDNYGYMSDPQAGGGFADHANARLVYARLTGTAQPRMPMGGPFWPAEQLAMFENWMEDGFQP